MYIFKHVQFNNKYMFNDKKEEEMLICILFQKLGLDLASRFSSHACH